MIVAMLVSSALAAQPKPTPTFMPEEFARGYKAGVEEVLMNYSELRLLAQAKHPGFFIVTATATATPWPTEQPTPTGDCCHDGHPWQRIKVGREHAGGRLTLHYLEWKRRGIPEEPRDSRFYGRTSVDVQRCRRCGLWREKP